MTLDELTQLCSRAEDVTLSDYEGMVIRTFPAKELLELIAKMRESHEP